ncbi:hypothetical protein BK128_17485 [Viridibacillus sp. FSL H7-0596]|uniref:GNAT family N-acetyltransferase n=1 Tax=unclassified Viridibacillus TaxID=2617942 RepID=UPI00096FAD40|nr:GNAT family N-acetyltransferase [Viridibacillus sp. FSL H7-0596]OMC84363.1 hypothetical protein BK128_17485 [Viridibacillus sp. FSL H7-0596]
MEIIDYRKEYEEGWLRCRVLAYLHTSMYEDVVTSKPTFEGRNAIELIAIENGEVIGVLDMILDDESEKTTALGEGLGAFLQLIAVHPDHQHKGVGLKLYDEAVNRIKNSNISFIELYTRGDKPANNFYKKLGFEKRLEYYDVFGVEKILRQPISMKFKNGVVNAEYENGEQCDYIITDGVYEVYNLEALEKLDVERYYPARGYYKKL